MNDISTTTTKMICSNCNKRIKHDYYWNGQMLGLSCWKKIALPELEKKRKEQREVWKRQDWMKNFALVEALKQKDYSKIKSEFKLTFLHDLIDQFESKGFISYKQRELVYGVGGWNGKFYDYGMLNDTDKLHEAIALYLIGDDEMQRISISRSETFNDKLKAQFDSSMQFAAKDSR